MSILGKFLDDEFPFLADQILNEDLTPVKYHFDGEVAPAKTKNRIPHDLGNPGISLLGHIGNACWDEMWIVTFVSAF